MKIVCAMPHSIRQVHQVHQAPPGLWPMRREGLAFDEPTNVTELRLIILVLADELVPDERVGISEALAIKIARGRGGVPQSRGSIAVRPRCGAMRAAKAKPAISLFMERLRIMVCD